MTSVGFFNPSEKEEEIKRRRLIAQQLSAIGQVNPNEMVSGIVVQKSPLEQLTRGLATGLGAYENSKASADAESLGTDRQKYLSEALKTAGNDPRAAANALLQDPASADLGARLYADVLSGERQDKQFERQAALQEAQFNRSAGLQRDLMAERRANEAEDANLNFERQKELYRMRFGGGGDVEQDPVTGQIYSNKPLPTDALKLQNEAIDNLAAATNASQLSSNLVKKVENGTLNLSPTDNIISRARNFAGQSSPESQAFAQAQTDIEKLRNDTLRLNKGVQTEGDAQRALNEVLGSINDPKVFANAMQKLQTINDRAAELQRLQVNNIRSNYKVKPYDFESVNNLTNAQATVTVPNDDVTTHLRNKGLSDQQIAQYRQSKGI